MKTPVKIFRWNKGKNLSEIKVGYFDNSRKLTCKDIELARRTRELEKEMNYEYLGR